MSDHNHTKVFIAGASDIDELAHVNNAVWVRWIQELATSHWLAGATAEQIADYVWVVVRHEIDYLANIREGESVSATTWVGSPPQGAKFDRQVLFEKNGQVVVRAKSTWAMIERASGRIKRVPREVAARFLSDGNEN